MARKALINLAVWIAQECDDNLSEASRRLGVPRQTLQHILNGHGTTVDTARRIHVRSRGLVDWRTLGSVESKVAR